MDSAKFSVSNIGMEVYGARARTARCEIVTNSIISNNPISFSIENLSTFIKHLSLLMM